MPNATPTPNAAPKTGADRAPLRRRLGAWLGGAMAVALAAGAGAAALDVMTERAASRAEPIPTPPLAVAALTLRLEPGYAVTERYSGRVEPARRAALGFERGGLLTEVSVEEGEAVAQAQALARLDARMLGIDAERLAAERDRAEARLALATRTQARQGDLSAKGFATEQRFDEAETEMIALRAEIATIDAALAANALEREKATLVAPFAGRIAARRLDPGAVVAAGQPVLDLVEDGRPQARIGLPAAVASRLSLGSAAVIEIAGTDTPATLAALRPDVDPSTRLVDALYDLAPEAGSPALGEVARLSLAAPSNDAAPGAWVPIAALEAGTKGLWTLATLEPENDAEGRPSGVHLVGAVSVEVLTVAADRAYVRGALVDGQRVIAMGGHRVGRGQRVRLLDDAAIADTSADTAVEPAR